jgi:GDSL-like lipase/acylhydrolase family protein
MTDQPVTIPTHRKIIYLAVIVVALLAVCEVGLRARQWMRYGSFAASVRDPMLEYDPQADLLVPKPGYEVKGARIDIKINSLGFRGDDFERRKPPHTVRIAALGASTTFCAEVSDNHKTWPHRLQEKLADAYPGLKFEVINTAVGGYTAAENLRNLTYRVLPLEPDLALYYEGNNEITKDTRQLALARGLIASANPQALARTISNYSLLFDLTYKNLTILAGRHNIAATARAIDSVPPDLPNHFIGQLDEMRRTLASRDIPLVLSTFIVKFRRNQPRATQLANADVEFYYMPWMSIDGMLSAMDTYNLAILDYAGRSGVPVVDDRDAVPPDAEHFSDAMHFVDKGAEAMADRFFNYLRTSRELQRAIAKARAVQNGITR